MSLYRTKGADCFHAFLNSLYIFGTVCYHDWLLATYRSLRGLYIFHSSLSGAGETLYLSLNKIIKRVFASLCEVITGAEDKLTFEAL